MQIVVTASDEIITLECVRIELQISLGFDADLRLLCMYPTSAFCRMVVHARVIITYIRNSVCNAVQLVFLRIELFVIVIYSSLLLLVIIYYEGEIKKMH